MKKRIIILSIILLVIVLLIPLVVSSAQMLILYNPENGKPVIVAGEEIPEELMGEEVSIMIPLIMRFIQNKMILETLII